METCSGRSTKARQWGSRRVAKHQQDGEQKEEDKKKSARVSTNQNPNTHIHIYIYIHRDGNCRCTYTTTQKKDREMQCRGKWRNSPFFFVSPCECSYEYIYICLVLLHPRQAAIKAIATRRPILKPTIDIYYDSFIHSFHDLYAALVLHLFLGIRSLASQPRANLFHRGNFVAIQ